MQIRFSKPKKINEAALLLVNRFKMDTIYRKTDHMQVGSPFEASPFLEDTPNSLAETHQIKHGHIMHCMYDQMMD